MPSVNTWQPGKKRWMWRPRSYQAGAGDYLTVLTAQHRLWSAQSSLIALQQTDFGKPYHPVAIARGGIE